MSAMQAALAFTSPQEGGYSQNESDPGGWTGGAVGHGSFIGSNLGVSAALLSEWLDRTATVNDMRSLTVDVRNSIFGTLFWNQVRGDELPLGVGLSTVDMQFNSGVNGARCLQRALNITVDGWIGPATIASCKAVLTVQLSQTWTLQGAKLMQSEMNLHPDGYVGPITISAFNAMSPAQARAFAIIGAEYDRQCDFYRSSAGFIHFGVGWLNRAAARLKAAVQQARLIDA